MPKIWTMQDGAVTQIEHHGTVIDVIPAVPLIYPEEKLSAYFEIYADLHASAITSAPVPPKANPIATPVKSIKSDKPAKPETLGKTSIPKDVPCFVLSSTDGFESWQVPTTRVPIAGINTFLDSIAEGASNTTALAKLCEAHFPGGSRNSAWRTMTNVLIRNGVITRTGEKNMTTYALAYPADALKEHAKRRYTVTPKTIIENFWVSPTLALAWLDRMEKANVVRKHPAKDEWTYAGPVPLPKPKTTTVIPSSGGNGHRSPTNPIGVERSVPKTAAEINFGDDLNEACAFVVFRLYRLNKIGGAHTSEENLRIDPALNPKIGDAIVALHDAGILRRHAKGALGKNEQVALHANAVAVAVEWAKQHLNEKQRAVLEASQG